MQGTRVQGAVQNLEPRHPTNIEAKIITYITLYVSLLLYVWYKRAENPILIIKAPTLRFNKLYTFQRVYASN